ncbi:hypothetical protein L6164_000137 [Bauhinia variegata]|uniref:Uncharacterized protein n=1 Tax=Bauhinia variegata TaxID=167791 RepID=A0ACB9Q7S4_BAUVA|nr:hypothetical protein L6164_000137 [Bauhinia variegata]
MSTLEDTEAKNHVQSPTAPPVPPSVENPTPTTEETGVTGIVQRWERDDLFKKGLLALRGLALIFSLISFIVMASNSQGDWRKFDRFEEYRYVLAIAILSTLYTVAQVFRQIQELSTGKNLLQRKTASLIDFFGDQIMAYLLMSSASSAVPLTNRLRESADTIFSDSSAAAISMSFMAFLCLGASAMISGYKLSTQPYI